MKILLDENIPIAIKKEFKAAHVVFTVRDMNWLGKKNGELLQLMLEKKFEVFITVDKNLTKQNQLQKLSVRIFVLNSKDNKIPTLIPFISLVEEQLQQEKLSNPIAVNLQ